MIGRRVVMRSVMVGGMMVLAARVSMAQVLPLFRSATTFTTGSVSDALPILIAADVGGPGDTPADGVVDLITAQESGMEATVLIGIPDASADGLFETAPASFLGVVPTALAVGDFDGDTILDLVASDNDQNITFLHGNNDGTFGTPGPLMAAGSDPRALIAADINSDQKLDLLVVNDPDQGPGSVTVLLGNGNGTFQEPGMTIQTAVGSRAATIGDFNNDTKSDLAVVNEGSNSLTILRGNGSGGFTFAQPIDFGTMPVRDPLAIATADLNADTRPDLVVVNRNSDEVAVLNGLADHSFGVPRFFPSGGMNSAPNGLAIADINRDVKTDVITSNNFSFDVSVLLGDGQGNLGSARAFIADQEPLAIVAQDFNGDGIPDVATVNRGIQISQASVAVLLGRSDGSLTGVEDIAALSDPTSMTVGDADNDGLPDLIVSHDSGAVVVYRALRSGGFAPAATLDSDGNVVAVVRGDVNGDSLLDIIALNNSSGPSSVSVFLARLTGGFSTAQTYPVGNGATALTIGDWNQDGRDDLAVVRQGSGSSGAVEILLASATGSLSETPQSVLGLAVGQNPTAIDVGDFNEDGKVDLVVGNTAPVTDVPPQSVSLLLGNGDGSFQAKKDITGTNVNTAGGVTGLIVADFDRDSHDDLAISKPATSAVQIFYGDGTEVFVPFPGASPPSVQVVSALAARDLNGDSFPDLVLTDGPNNIATVFRVDTSIPTNLRRFRADARVTVGRMPVRVASADFDGDGRYDAATLTNSVASAVSVMTNVRTAPVLRGDGNGDAVVSAADTVAVVRDVGLRRIRTRLEQRPVGGGTFPGAPGVDANGDGLVTPQDAVAVAHLLFAGI